MGIYFIPILIFIIPATLLFLIIRIFKKVSLRKTLNISLIIAGVVQILIFSCIQWSLSDPGYTRQQVVKDIDYAIKTLEDVHPDPYTTISRADFYHNVDSIKQVIPEKVSALQAYKILRMILSPIQEGHTNIGLNYFTKRIAIRKTLPYRLLINKDRIFIAKNYSYRNSIPVGSEILEINGKSVIQCLQEVSSLLGCENSQLRNAILQYPMFWGLWNDNKNFEIKYKTPENKTGTITTYGGIVSNIMYLKEMASIGNDYSFEIKKGNIGYIAFNSCRNIDKFKVFLSEAFAQIKNRQIKNLVIDIRKNSGGSGALGNEVMQYISKTGFRQMDAGFVKVSNEILADKSNNTLSKVWIDSVKPDIGKVYDIVDKSETNLRLNPLRYTGNTYLLIGGYTFSSAVDFASAFKCYKAGTIIGTETGGLTSGYGNVYSCYLPETGFDISIPCTKWVTACGRDDHKGIMPDYAIEDDQNPIDKALSFTLELINRK